jgi:hypothetical protein
MVGYAIFAFAVLQVVEPIMHGAHLPEWVLTSVLVALAVGFPVALVLAWVFDVTAQGVRRTPPIVGSSGVFVSRGRLAALLLGVALVAALPGFGWYVWKQASERGRPVSDKPVADGRVFVAVADFANQTGDPSLDGLSGLLITSLEQSKRLRVMTRGRMWDHLRAMGKGDV